MSAPVLAIDPGAAGGFAWRDAQGVAQAIKMPDGMTAQINAIRDIVASRENFHAVVEDVGGYMPGNSGPGAVTFARHCGNIEAALFCLGIPTRLVTPQKWMKAGGFGPSRFLPSYITAMAPDAQRKARADAKRESKAATKEAMQRRNPHLRVTLATADALAILEWAEANRPDPPAAPPERQDGAGRGLDRAGGDRQP